MHIFVGSTNPVKVNSVIEAASETWPEVVVKGFDVPSGISEQPMSDEETKQGAFNRAKVALEKGLQAEPKLNKEKVLGVGLEGGVFKSDDELWSTVWAVVVDSKDNHHASNGARFLVPKVVADLILSGQEMGPIVSELIGEADVRKKQGMIGVITQGFIDRTEEYTGIIKMALGLWYGRDWYNLLRSKS